jgi:predicted metal-binding membrane protein
MHAHAVPPAIWTIVPLTAMWLGMMAVMMTPAVWPWVAAYHRFDPRAHRWAQALSTLAFASGYLAAWLVYAIPAASLQLTLTAAGLAGGDRGAAEGVAALLLIGAGTYQFAPLKRACLTHCRSPFGYFLLRWHDGPTGGLRLGFRHGLFCVGCCWALMATSLVVGMTNVWWMAALTVVAFVEQVVPRGDRLRVPLGLALIVAGLYAVSP